MSAVTFLLIAKELYSYRWIIAAAIAAGLFSLVLASTGEMAFNIGALAWLTTIIASGVMLPMYGIHQERKDRTLLFALSLPISPAGYARAKMMGILSSFVVLWSALTIGAVILVLASPGIPDGLLPYLLLLSCFLLVNFSLVMCCSFLSTSEIAISAAIILTNMGVTVFMMLVGRASAIGQHMLAEAPVWNSTFFLILGGEAAAFAIALSLPLIAISRRRDFI
jgi:ABC-2 type transport system permease protein